MRLQSVMYLLQLIFIFSLCLGMVRYANEFKRKENNKNIWNEKLTATHSYRASHFFLHKERLQ